MRKRGARCSEPLASLTKAAAHCWLVAACVEALLITHFSLSLSSFHFYPSRRNIPTPARSCESLPSLSPPSINSVIAIAMPAKDETKSAAVSGDQNGKGGKSSLAPNSNTDGPCTTIAELDTKLSTFFSKKLRNLEKRKVCY